LPVAILRELGVNRVRLLTNNPAKARALTDAGIEVVARIPCEAKPNPYSLPYLRTKKERMDHALSLPYRDDTGQSKDLRRWKRIKTPPDFRTPIFEFDQKEI
jgi:hypothetical protein